MSDDFDLNEPSSWGEILGMLAMGVVFGGCGVLMMLNLLSGEAEFVHGPRTGNIIVRLLGENLFMVVSALVCLLLGLLGLVGGLYCAYDRLAPKADE
jgi:hypothetical protein